jgi:hypothetical protein
MRTAFAACACALAARKILLALKFSHVCDGVVSAKTCLDAFDTVVASMNPVERKKFDDDFSELSQEASLSNEKCRGALKRIQAQAQPLLLKARFHETCKDWLPQSKEDDEIADRGLAGLEQHVSYEDDQEIMWEAKPAASSRVVDDEARKDTTLSHQWSGDAIDDGASKSATRPKYDQVDEGPEVVVLVGFIVIGMSLLILLLCYRLKWFTDIWRAPTKRTHDLLERSNSIWTPAPQVRHHGAKRHKE